MSINIADRSRTPDNRRTYLVVEGQWPRTTDPASALVERDRAEDYAEIGGTSLECAAVELAGLRDGTVKGEVIIEGAPVYDLAETLTGG